jgi:serine/threonine-protein phosphatase 6 regulatory ankyrin repeat subunit B
LLENGANVDSKDTLGTTPLIIASNNGNYEIVELLLKYGATIDITDKRGHSAMLLASCREKDSDNHKKVVNLLNKLE